MSVKRIDPKATFRVIVETDSALINETPAERDTGSVDADGKPVLKPSRYEKYSESFDPKDLKFKDGETPDIFVIRGLTSLENANLIAPYTEFDVSTRRNKIKNESAWLLDVFKTACLGIEVNGVVEKVTADELPLDVPLRIATLVTLVGALGKNLKKP